MLNVDIYEQLYVSFDIFHYDCASISCWIVFIDNECSLNYDINNYVSQMIVKLIVSHNVLIYESDKVLLGKQKKQQQSIDCPECCSIILSFQFLLLNSRE